ncbi:PC-esterase domain-containing protein 1A-like isoform X1 [Bufo gargarizans]|uniref:PC-esterase domain-containing protein 1A-like isoform X1 n=1 Tax=Bufo gargarizans TaxID=30331 RepID=UPI001CF21EE9|nr:PC-esterase domain-containing protein 1A-like isoform X1 [Bufo gargarizans]
MGCFHSADVRKLLHNKYVVVLGDSIQRSVYKDLVKMLQDDTFLSEAQLKRKGELSFENDALVEGGELDGLHNETTFREVRQYRSGHHLVRFYFLTRVYSTYLESVLSDFQSDPQPDVLIANSCVWDVNRYNDKHLEAYKTNLDTMFQRLKEVLSPECLIIWNTTMPVGYKDSEILGYMVHNLRMDVVEGNFFSATLANLHKLDVLDMHYHFRCDLHLRCRDSIHWNQVAHRKYTQILLTHIAQAWGVEVPKGKILEETAYIPGYTSFDESGINDMPDFLSLGYYTDEKIINSDAASPFVTDSPLLTANITPGYFTPSPGPMFTRPPFARRKMKITSWRGGRMHPYC